MKNLESFLKQRHNQYGKKISDLLDSEIQMGVVYSTRVAQNIIIMVILIVLA